jgi:thiamine pyrophosphokinase
VLNYNLCQYQITASTNCLITIYQSNDLTTYVTSSVSYTTPNVTQTYSLPLSAVLVKFNVQNNTLVNQTSLSLRVLYRNSPPIGKTTTQLWTTISSGVGGFSNIVDNSLNNCQTITFTGSVGGATDLTVQSSVSGTTFYNTQSVITLASGGDVGFTIQSASPYIRVQSSADVSILLYATCI